MSESWHGVVRAAGERHAAQDDTWVRVVVGRVGRARRRRVTGAVGTLAAAGALIAGASLILPERSRPAPAATTDRTPPVTSIAPGWAVGADGVLSGVDVDVSVPWDGKTVVGSCPTVTLPVGRPPGPQDLPLWSGSGAEWRRATPVSLETPVTCVSSLAATGRGLVATVDGAVLRSDDGLTWVPVALPGVGGTPVIVSVRGDAVVVGAPRADDAATRGLWTSTDTRTWRSEPAADGDVPGAGVRAALSGRDVVVGAEGGGLAPSAAAAWFSADGSAWGRADVERAANCTMTDVVPWDGGLAAVGRCEVGDEVAVWTSPDGATWRRVAGPDVEGVGSLVGVRAWAAVAGDRLVVSLAAAGGGPDGTVGSVARRQWVGIPGGAWFRSDDLVAPFHAAGDRAFWPADSSSAPEGGASVLERVG